VTSVSLSLFSNHFYAVLDRVRNESVVKVAALLERISIKFQILTKFRGFKMMEMQNVIRW
jgi:hypothetical protein